MLSNQLEIILGYIPRESGLPRPTKRIGSGVYGTAYRTKDPKWILKVTSDTMEIEKIRKYEREHKHLLCNILHYERSAIIDRWGEHWDFIWKEKCVTIEDLERQGKESADAFVRDHTNFRQKLNWIDELNDGHRYNCGYNSQGRMVVFDP